MTLIAEVNQTRYTPGQAAGHYESFFQRGNHPTRPLAFWIRYTIFSPKSRPQEAVGELWAIFFDGERRRHAAVKQVWPLAACQFARDAFAVRVGEATLGIDGLRGRCAGISHEIAWDLRYEGDQPPSSCCPATCTRAASPKPKAW